MHLGMISGRHDGSPAKESIEQAHPEAGANAPPAVLGILKIGDKPTGVGAGRRSDQTDHVIDLVLHGMSDARMKKNSPLVHL